LVTDEFEKHAHTIKARKLTTSVVGLDQSICVARSMLKVVLGNLIQNAVSYSGQSILVSINADSIVVENSSAANEAHTNTNGLGLEIVERVCDRLGWTLSANQQDEVFVAKVQFAG
jgi:signal transduction histidine kinase